MIFVHVCESFKFGEYWGEIQGGKHAQGEGGYQGRVKQVRGDRGAVCVCAAFPHAVIGRTAMSHVRHSLYSPFHFHLPHHHHPSRHPLCQSHHHSTLPHLPHHHRHLPPLCHRHHHLTGAVVKSVHTDRSSRQGRQCLTPIPLAVPEQSLSSSMLPLLSSLSSSLSKLPFFVCFFVFWLCLV